jgi:hypothetical protein
MSYSPTSLRLTRDWRADAECRNHDPEMWHPNGTTGPSAVQAADAKAVCQQCPVLGACRQWALDRHEQHGVWGGMTENDRAAYYRRISRARIAAEGPKVRTPIIVFPSIQRAYDANTLTDGDHLVWVGGNEVKIDGHRYSPNQIAWRVTRGSPPVGRVLPDCDRPDCVQHLADQTTREARKAAEQPSPPVSKCGTRPGYHAHRARSEEACQPCKDANADADRRLRNTGTTKQLATA